MELKAFGGLTLVGPEGRPVAIQRRRLGLLTVIALAGPRGVSRDRLLGFFWAETDEERGRGALAQALYALRRLLGRDDLFTGTGDVALAPGVLAVDALAFDEDLRAGRPVEAIARYHGPFLDGFYLNEAPEFERWVDDHRARYARAHRDALEQAATVAHQAGRPGDALPHWHQLASLDPTNSRVMMGLMRSAAAAGDRAAAVRQARIYAELMAAEGLRPDVAVAVLAEELRSAEGTGAAERMDGQGTALPTAPSTTSAAPPPLLVSPAGPPRRRTFLIAGAVATVVLVAVALGLVERGRENQEVVFAVGRILNQSGEIGAAALSDMLTTSLARVPGLSVVSSARMYELTGGDTARVLAAARRAGATELLDGTVFSAPGGGYRLEWRRTAVADGRVLTAARLEGPDLFTLADSVTASLAAARGAPAPTAPLAAQTTTSVTAYRLYSEGLRAYFSGNPVAARALLDQAVVEDSMFALGWLWAARVQGSGSNEWRRRILRGVELAPRAPERERLLLLLEWVTYQDVPARLALADTLARLFPDDPEAQLQLGVVLQWDGQFLAAAAAFERAWRLDRGGLAQARRGERCLACEAVASMSAALRMADSMAAALRPLRRWTQEAPASADAWFTLADALMFTGRADEAYAAERVAAPLDRPERAATVRALIAIHAAEEWAAGAEFFAAQAARPELEHQLHGLWWLIITRRHQGRLDEALALARRYVELGGIRSLEPQILYEQGEFAAAARAFRAIADDPPADLTPTRLAREIAWYLTHTATALAAAGDTASLLALADSVEVLGRQTAYGRDRRLHHHIRGLLYAARGHHAEAIESFARALFSVNSGYTRSNYHLAGVLLDAGQPAEAVRALRPVLHGPLEASGLYLNRSDVHERLGRAFEAAGHPDSALTHYRRAIAAWRDADPAVAERRRALEERVLGLRRGAVPRDGR